MKAAEKEDGKCVTAISPDLLAEIASVHTTVPLPSGPCLVIEWTQITEDRYNWKADYYLRLPIGNDIRNECENFREGCLHIPLGETKSDRANDPPIRKGIINGTEEDIVDTPFRDGCHIKWDAQQLRLPAYAICGNTISSINPYVKG